MAPTYYIKGSKGEVDIALVQQKTMLPVEIKWTKRIRPEDLKQIRIYKNGIILTQSSQTQTINANIVLPLIRFLVHIDDNKVVLK
jgi:predicted AAA+ superfamily ATPase